MAEKKWQHYVPQVYLKSFTDTVPPSGWPAERPFQPVVWIAQPRALDSFRRKAPVNILASNRLYNLRSDDPERPWLEESFGQLETHYERVLGVLKAQQYLDDDLYGMLILFIAALSARTPGSIDHCQSFVDDLERIHRMVVSGDATAEADADRLFTDSDEAGRRLIPEWAQAYAEVVGPAGFIIVNQSAMEFITSDQPVSHLFLHVDERPIASFPVSLRASVKPNVQAHFSFTPLTPQLAFVSPLCLTQVIFTLKRLTWPLFFRLINSHEQWRRTGLSLVAHGRMVIFRRPLWLPRDPISLVNKWTDSLYILTKVDTGSLRPMLFMAAAHILW